MRWVGTIAAGVVAGLVGTVLVFAAGHQSTAANSADKSRVPLLGTTVASSAQLKRNTAEFGHMPIIHVYFRGLPPRNAWTRGRLAASKSAVIVSFNAPPRKIISGAANAALSHFFDTAPTGHPIYYSYIHEPEHEIIRGRFSTAAYKAAWSHVVRLARAAHDPYLRSTLILMAYDLRRGAHRNWKDYLPGGGIISTLGWDAYPGASTPRPPSQFMGPAVAASKSMGLPFGFAEFGMSSTAIRADWLRQVGRYLMNSGALFGTLFDSPRVYPSYMMTNTASIAVWRQFVQESARANGILVNTRPAKPHRATSRRDTALQVVGLALSKPALAAGGRHRITIGFRLTKPADVTVVVLNRRGTVIRLLARPQQAAGRVRLSYNGDGRAGRAEPAGTYQILVVASNPHGSATAELPLRIR